MAHDGFLGTHLDEFLQLRESCRQYVSFVRAFPSEVFAAATKVSVCGSLLIYGAFEVQHRDKSLWSQIKVFTDKLNNFVVANFTCAIGIHADGGRFGNANGVTHLNFAAFGKACCNDIFGDIATCISRRPIYLEGSLPEKAPPPCRAMPP